MKVKIEISAGGIVYKKDTNRILWLIIQHSQHKGWVFPKGLVGDEDENESMEKAALREVEEEGGIKAMIVNKQPVTTNYMYRFQNTLVKKTVFYFLMEYVSGDPKNHDFEVFEAKFLTEKEIFTTLTYKTDRQAFEEILTLLN